MIREILPILIAQEASRANQYTAPYKRLVER